MTSNPQAVVPYCGIRSWWWAVAKPNCGGSSGKEEEEEEEIIDQSGCERPSYGPAGRAFSWGSWNRIWSGRLRQLRALAQALQAEDHVDNIHDEVVRAAVALIPALTRSISVVTARRDVTSQSRPASCPPGSAPSRPSSVRTELGQAPCLDAVSKSSPSECPTCLRRNAGPASPVTDLRAIVWITGRMGKRLWSAHGRGLVLHLPLEDV